MSINEKIENLKGKLIVSCQALPSEPLHSPFIMGRMALAAKIGGASGIRANTKEDIAEIQTQVDLPIIGIVKRDYEDSEIYITPTMKEIDELMEVKPEIIAMDATISTRPGNKTLDKFFHEVKEKYPDQLFMADCSTIEEALHADELGFDFIGTTMVGYTKQSEGQRNAGSHCHAGADRQGVRHPPAHPAGDRLHGARSGPAAPRLRDRPCRCRNSGG